NHKNILFFTNYGKVYRLKAYQIPEASRTARGISIRNLLPLAQNEKVVSTLAVDDFDRESTDKNIIIATRKGLIKKTALSEFASTRRDGLKAINLNEGDSIVQVKLTNGNDDVLLVTKKGMTIRFCETDVRRMGRGAAGVKGITLKEGDEVLDMVIVKQGEKLLLVTEDGYGKRTSYENFSRQHRGGKGLIGMKVNEKTGIVAAARGVEEDEEVLIVSAEGQAIRVKAKDVSEQGRPTMGVIVMRLSAGDKVTAIAIID
ncbi:MAG: DNA gyrase subunit A, partial [Actinobacteria bacterium]|nr:DNA gyrase subunit A [Actinomycetota bacterium]